MLKKALVLTALLAATQFSHADVLNDKNPEGFKQFRFDLIEMQDISNPTKLGHRDFYLSPSEGPDAEWFDAVKQGNTVKVKEMVKNGQNLEAKDEASFGQTALGWAAFIGYEDIVDFLVDQGADLFATDRADAPNSLKSATLGKNINVFKKLHEKLKDKVDINNQSSDKEGETLLIVASSNGRNEIVEYLLQQGADTKPVTTIQDKNHPAYDQDALTFACRNGHTDTAKILVQYGATNHRTGQPACDYKAK